MQMALAMRRAELQDQHDAPEIVVDTRLHARIVRRFPFDLTRAQQTAVDAICTDLAKPHPMNRLLQGDVGSGKTIVAVYAMLAAVAHGYQAAMMAPTEVLARQHYRSLDRMLAGSDVQVALLAGAQTSGERNELRRRIESGDVQLIVGTQAVIQESIKFDDLGLVIVDEQHKFGVRQRATLRDSGHAPHYLVMTATPIPRTISMTLFGDLDVSTLDESPPGRRAVHTYVGSPDQKEQWWQFVRNKLHEGRQAYVITPLVDESDGSLAMCAIDIRVACQRTARRIPLGSSAWSNVDRGQRACNVRILDR